MKELLKHVDELNVHIQHLEEDIDRHMKADEKQAADAVKDVTGIGITSTQAIISVIGTDMGHFPTDAHISSWARLCPGDNESAGKRMSGKTPVADNLNCVHTFRGEGKKFLLSCAVPEDQRSPWQQKSLCGSGPFHADCHILHSEG